MINKTQQITATDLSDASMSVADVRVDLKLNAPAEEKTSNGLVLVQPGGESVVAQLNPKFLDRWQICGLPDARRNIGQKPPFVIEDLLLSQSATLVSAQPHAMKSLSLLAACMDAVAKRKVWGHFSAPDVDSTLFIETEDPQWLVEARINGLAKGLGLDDEDQLEGFHYACVGPFDLLEEKRRMEDLIGKYDPKLVVLSTLQNLLHNRNWTSQQDMQPIMAAVIELSRICPIMLVTHSPWDKRQKRAAGTITQAANFATALHYEKKYSKEMGSHVKVKVDCKAGMADSGFALRLETEGPRNDPGSVRRLLYDQLGSRSSSKDAILQELQSDPDCSNAEIADRVEASIRYVQQTRKEWEQTMKKSPKSTTREGSQEVREG